jgi:hypothetical protein
VKGTRAAIALAALIGVLCAAPDAPQAHTITTDEVLARLRAPANKAAFAIEDAAPLEGLPRLLVIRVGAGWSSVSVERRRAAAEGWRRAWQHAIDQGIVSIVDARTGKTVVHFDPQGRAQLAR